MWIFPGLDSSKRIPCLGPTHRLHYGPSLDMFLESRPCFHDSLKPVSPLPHTIPWNPKTLEFLAQVALSFCPGAMWFSSLNITSWKYTLLMDMDGEVAKGQVSAGSMTSTWIYRCQQLISWGPLLCQRKLRWEEKGCWLGIWVQGICHMSQCGILESEYSSFEPELLDPSEYIFSR